MSKIARSKNLRKMSETAKSKSGYGLCQIKGSTVASHSKVLSDPKAIRGKKILREKIYGIVK